MISYKPFWATLKKRKISTYKLISDYNISSSTINRLRHNQPVTTTTLDDLCKVLDCKICDIVTYIKEPLKNKEPEEL